MGFRFMVLMLAMPLWAACAQLGRSADPVADTFPVKIRWMGSSSATAENLTVKVAIGDCDVWVGTLPAQAVAIIDEIKIPKGISQIHIEIAGRASATMAIMGAPDQEIDLFLNTADNASEGVKSPSPLSLCYQVRDSSPSTPSTEINYSDNNAISRTMPITLNVYSTDSGEPTGSQDSDIFLRIYIDKSLVYDGVARAGNLRSAEFIFRVKPGIHLMSFACIGDEKDCVVNSAAPSWVSVYCGRRAVSHIRTAVSNTIIPSM